jgi:hypothetical protein
MKIIKVSNRGVLKAAWQCQQPFYMKISTVLHLIHISQMKTIKSSKGILENYFTAFLKRLKPLEDHTDNKNNSKKNNRIFKTHQKPSSSL